jgi:hypothetical protein
VNHLNETPLILVGKMWPGLVDWVKTSMLSTDHPLVNPEDINIPQCVPDANNAIALIRKHHAQWARKHGGNSSAQKANSKRKSARAGKRSSM